MKKLKLFIFTLLSVLTLGLFVVTGSKVEAVAVATEYDFYTVMKGDYDSSSSVNIINGSGSVKYTATTKGGTKTADLTVTLNGTKDKTYFKWNKSGYFEFTVNAQTDTLTLSFETTGADASVESIIHTGGGSKYYTYYIDSSETGTEFANGNTSTNKTFSFVTAGNHSIKFQRIASDNISTSNMKIYTFTINDSYNDSSVSNESLAVAAIENIGTVTYSQDSLDLINSAKNAVMACDEANRNAEHISNYATYTAAISSFETLESSAITTFTNSVSTIGEIVETSITKINTAKSNYEVLFGDSLTNDDVKSAKEQLDSLESQYMLEFGEKVTTLLTSSISSSLKNNTAYSSDTRFYTNSESSIFFGCKASSIQEGNGKTYNNVSYTDRFKTNGVIALSSGVVSCALRVDAPSGGVLSIVGISGNGTSTRNLKLTKIVTKNDNSQELVTIQDLGNIVGGSDAGLYSLNIPSAGTYYIGSDTVKESGKSAGGVNMYKFEFKKYTELVTSTTAAFQSADKDSLRIVGTISGVTDTTSIKSIELVLLKDGVATKNQIFLTTVYTSITGVNGFGEVTNTYYVVFKITGIKESSIMPNNTEISHKLKVTFTDDSYVESTANVSTWNN